MNQPQPAIVADLLRPDAYPHPADDLRLHETHLSWVILAGAYAYKLRKPVDLGFVDFTTVEQRRADCQEEVRLNRRLSPELYLGVVEVTRDGGRYRVGAETDGGEAGEPAVRMRRLPEDGMLPALLARGAADQRLLRRIARRLARFHASAATGPGVDQYGSPETVRANWDENFAQLQPFVGRTVSDEVNDAIRAFVEHCLREQAPLLARRVREGRVRDGHGDLHAASICVERNRIHLFDCLQFTPRFRCGDVAGEVAFLAMDLEHFGRADLAWAFVDAYVRASGDAELPGLLDFYACYRAYVRGKVRSLRLEQPGLAADETAPLVAEARSYFDLAWAHAGGLAAPTILVSMGLPASGKTTLAQALAGRLGLVHLSSDVVRKTAAGVALTEYQSHAFREGLYDAATTRRTYAALRRLAARWLRRRRSVVLDATYGSPAERAALVRLARRLGARLLVLECHAEDETLRQRLAARSHQPGVVSDARLDVWPELRAAFVAPTELPDVIRLDAQLPPEALAAQALAHLRLSAPPDLT